jgi:hypothetical protein
MRVMGHSRFRALLVVSTLAAGLGARDARAQSNQGNAAAAQVLFDDAKALMAKGKYAEACPKLEESQKLQPGGGTVMFLALCHEGEGKTATAWTEFNTVLSVARRDHRADREKVAREHLATLEPVLIRLTIAVSDPAASVAELVVKRDREPVAKALWGTAVPIDPGPHTVEAAAPSYKPWSQTFSASRPGEQVTVTVPELTQEAPVAAKTEEPAATVRPPTVAAAADDPRSSWNNQKTLALVLGGVGVVGLGVGTVFGIEALSKKSEAEKSCPGGSSGGCLPEGVSASKTAVSNGNVSTIAFAAGAVALAAGVVLWLTAPKSRSTTALDPRSLPAAGRFSF